MHEQVETTQQGVEILAITGKLDEFANAEPRDLSAQSLLQFAAAEDDDLERTLAFP